MDEQISLKSMTMLIVDDDLLVLESLKKLFIKFEARVYSAKDGIEALAILKSTNIDFDLVISDINMPNLDGLSLLETTREFNKNINFIFVSAYTKPEYLLKAISHRAINYFRKPLDLKALLRCVIDISEDKHRKNLLELKEKETNEYLNILNQIAIISKTDIKGNITEVNDIFCEISGYEREELIGQPHNIVRHPEMPSAAFEDLWKTIKNKEIWRGKVKNKSKNGDSYFVNTTVYPLIDVDSKEILEFMSVRFLITEDELEKRNFKKNVMKTIADNKRQNYVARNKISDLENQLKKMNVLEENIEKEQEKNRKLLSQNAYYEDEIKQLKLEFYDSNRNLKDETNKFYQDFLAEKKVNEINIKKVISLTNDLELKEQEVLKLNEEVKSQNKIIVDLKDVIEHLEEKLELYK